MPLDEMDRFQKKQMKRITPVTNTWYDWLINHIPEYRIVGVLKIKLKIF